MIEDKIYEKLKLVSTKFLMMFIKPDLKTNRITEIDIDKLINDYNIKGLIIDVDDTLRYNMNPLSDEVMDWLVDVKDKLKVIVLSNGIDLKVKRELNSIDIEYISNSFKPFKRGFIKCLNVLNLKPENVLVIGNSVLTDILGSKRMDMKSLIVINKGK